MKGLDAQPVLPEQMGSGDKAAQETAGAGPSKLTLPSPLPKSAFIRIGCLQSPDRRAARLSPQQNIWSLSSMLDIETVSHWMHYLNSRFKAPLKQLL